MAAKRSKSQAKRSGGTPTWVWLLMGVLIGALAISAWLLRDRWQAQHTLLPQPNPDAQAPASSSDEGLADDAAPPEKPKPKYDFYTLLPEREVVIPDAELAEQARAEARKAAPKPTLATNDAAPTPAPPAAAATDGSRYLIQAGAFRDNAEAEALKAQIALTGEVARVESAQINGSTVYRVRMGPYASAGALAAAKQALTSHGITGAQAIRVK
ncbi:MAG TPA: SPOR domain-containing protein [Burkholderiaceae bacterium]